MSQPRYKVEFSMIYIEEYSRICAGVFPVYMVEFSRIYCGIFRIWRDEENGLPDSGRRGLRVEDPAEPGTSRISRL